MPWELNEIMGKGRYIGCHFHIHIARVVIFSPDRNKEVLKELWIDHFPI